MSGYRGRAGPNFSQFLSDLNTVSPPDYSFGAPEENEFSQDLAMFTNTDFTNIDIPSLGEDGSFNFDLAGESQAQNNVKYEDLLAASGPAPDFNQAPGLDGHGPGQQHFYQNYSTPIQPAPSSAFPNLENSQGAGPSGNRRAKPEGMQPDDASGEEKSRLAAEEDKRRRNTAASARFRVKKKQREQALEKTVKETSEKNAKLEAKLSQLEMENKWLKDLITEKNGLSSKEEMAAAYQEYRKESEERELKTEPAHVKGVGTK